MSFDMSPIAAMFAGDAQNQATQTNAQNVRNTNIANMLMQIMARGGAIDARTAQRLGLPPGMVGQSSSILPYYLSSIESNLGMKAGELSMAMNQISPTDQLSNYQSLIDKSQPSFDAATGFANDVTSGAEGNRMVQEGEPVAAARMGMATGKRNAALESLKQTLNDIDAIQSKKGFSGDSMGDRMMKFGARRSINTQAAGDITGAQFENSVDKQALLNQARQFRMNNLGASTGQAQLGASRINMPATAAANRFQASMAPLSFFNIGPHNYTPFQTPPMVGPNPGIGQLLAEGAGGQMGMAGNAAANYFGRQKWGSGGGDTSMGTYNSNPSLQGLQPDYSNYPSGYNMGTDLYSPPAFQGDVSGAEFAGYA